VIAKDIRGELWWFKHAYQGKPRRHVLTTGWTTFASQKKLVAGDLVVFVRAENGDLCVGIRRAKRAGIGGPDAPSGGTGKVRPEDVIEAESLAAKGQPFEVTYCPHESTPQFVVKASSVNAALCVQWCVGMRFKMAFETKDLCWFKGTVSSVQPFDPVLWPKSSWRVLQVIELCKTSQISFH
jgi:hypothetical protein